MGPRHHRRGSVSLNAREHDRPRASMGPRHHRRGSPSRIPPVSGSSCSFNGAATSSSRIGQPRATPALAVYASMGPRHHRRGSPAPSGVTVAGSAGFNGAATSSSRIGSHRQNRRSRRSSFNGAATSSSRIVQKLTDELARFIVLQWGRDIIVADRRLPAVGVRGHLSASMGPRHHRRGSSADVARFDG